jgi:hypothetical protein
MQNLYFTNENALQKTLTPTACLILYCSGYHSTKGKTTEKKGIFREGIWGNKSSIVLV